MRETTERLPGEGERQTVSRTREAETGQDALTNAMVDVAADAARGIGLSTSPSPADDVETVRRYDDPDLREVRMREEMAKVRADAIENAARVCEFRARSLAEDSHDYWASNEASKCAVAIRWLITNPTRFVALSGQEGK